MGESILTLEPWWLEAVFELVAFDFEECFEIEDFFDRLAE